MTARRVISLLFLVLVLWAAAFSSAVYALPKVTYYRLNILSNAHPGFLTREEACFYHKDYYGSDYEYSVGTVGSNPTIYCRVHNKTGGGYSNYWGFATWTDCPPNSSGSSCTCDAGFVEWGGQCVEPNACMDQQGQSVQASMFIGWCIGSMDTPDGVTCPGGFSGLVPPPSMANFNGCAATKGAIGNCYHYESNLSKVFCDVTYTFTGDPSSAPPTTNNAPTGACPSGATYGSVNGQSGCFQNTPVDPDDPDTHTPLPATPGAPPTTGDPTAPGDPNAPPGDGTGTGGGPNGGGVGGGPGGSPGGDGDFDCPECAKESTLQDIRDHLKEPMPEKEGTFDGAIGDLDTAAKAREDLIKDAAGDGMRTELGFSLDIAGYLPSGGCSPLSLSTPFGIIGNDWCDELAQVRLLWGWFLGILAALFVWRLGHSALRGGGK